MKRSLISIVIVLVAVMTFGFYGVSEAFHSGGVAECEGCHTMHNSLGGQPMGLESLGDGGGSGVVGISGPYLLRGSDQSSTCLGCHGQPDTAPSSYHIMTYPTPPAGTAPVELSPGGDFAWLQKTYSWIPRTGAATEYSEGQWKGHNIVAADFLYSSDTRNTIAPGGTYPAASLSCISCHDPHGKGRIVFGSTAQVTTGAPIRSSGSYGVDPLSGFAVGLYRLLGGVGYAPASASGYAFSQGAPYAAAPSSYNRSEAATDTRVVYGKNSSEWCANCHNAMHSVLTTVPNGYVHPTGTPLGSTIAANYNAYVKTGDLTGGTGATAFTSIIPFQKDNIDVNSTLGADRTSTQGPSSTDRVTCYSCHRAHASGWDSMTRFPLGNEFMTKADALGAPVYCDPVTDAACAMGRTPAETQQAMYDRPATKYAAYQRALCNKCHVKD